MNPSTWQKSPHPPHTLYCPCITLQYPMMVPSQWMHTQRHRLQWGHHQWMCLQHKHASNEWASNINMPQTNSSPTNMPSKNAPPTNLPPLLSPLLALTLGMNLLALTPCKILLLLVLNFSSKITFIFSERWIFTPPLHVFYSTQWSTVPSSVLHLSECTMN